jgi:hypothetical protein
VRAACNSEGRGNLQQQAVSTHLYFNCVQLLCVQMPTCLKEDTQWGQEDGQQELEEVAASASPGGGGRRRRRRRQGRWMHTGQKGSVLGQPLCAEWLPD